MKIYRHHIVINEKEEITINSQRKLNFVGLAKEIKAKHKGNDIKSVVIKSVKEEEISLDNV